IECDRNYAFAYFALGATFNMMNRYDDAIRVLDRGLALSPQSWQAYFEYGKAEVGKGEYEAALRKLNRAEDMAPHDYAPVHLVTAHALLALKNYSQAMSELEAYLEKDPKGSNAPAVRDSLDKIRAFAAAQH